MAANPEIYDVAVSFDAADEPLARQLADLLRPPHSVFVYSKAQEQLAGRDGIDAFRTVFLERAHLVVILYRPPWGETSWTRVEHTAIEELALRAGWEHLMFVRLDKSPVPTWVPKPHLYLDLNTFTLADLAGAIKARLVELGVEVAPVSPADRAAAIARQQQFDAETAQLLQNGTVEFSAAVGDLFAAIRAHAAEIAQSTGWEVRAGEGALIGGLVVSAEGQGIQLWTTDLYANTARKAWVELREYSARLSVAEPGKRYALIEPLNIAGRRRIEIRRLPELGWCWEFDGKIEPSEATAQAVVNVLLERIERAR